MPRNMKVADYIDRVEVINERLSLLDKEAEKLERILGGHWFSSNISFILFIIFLERFREVQSFLSTSQPSLLGRYDHRLREDILTDVRTTITREAQSRKDDTTTTSERQSQAKHNRERITSRRDAQLIQQDGRRGHAF